MVRVKSSLAPGASGSARLTGARGGVGQLVPGSRAQRDKGAGQDGEMGLGFHDESWKSSHKGRCARSRGDS